MLPPDDERAPRMTAVDLRNLADVLEQLAAAGFAVALELGGDLMIRATPRGRRRRAVQRRHPLQRCDRLDRAHGRAPGPLTGTALAARRHADDQDTA
jgi:hypothetical protein